MILLAIGTSWWERALQLVFIIIVFIVVLALAYFSTRWLAKYQKGVTGNKNIRVIETFRVTNNKFIQIIEVGDTYFVIAVGKDTITSLGEVSKENLTWLPDCDVQTPVVSENFQEILQKLKNKLPRK